MCVSFYSIPTRVTSSGVRVECTFCWHWLPASNVVNNLDKYLSPQMSLLSLFFSLFSVILSERLVHCLQQRTGGNGPAFCTERVLRFQSDCLRPRQSQYGHIRKAWCELYWPTVQGRSCSWRVSVWPTVCLHVKFLSSLIFASIFDLIDVMTLYWRLCSSGLYGMERLSVIVKQDNRRTHSAKQSELC